MLDTRNKPSWRRRAAARSRVTGATYPATPEAIKAARIEVVRIAREAGASDDMCHDIRLAVSEAASNAVVHAYDAAGMRGESFTVAATCRESVFTVWVADEGRGGKARAPSPGLGLGLGLMARLCERVDLGVLEDGRTQVEMRFDLVP
jgi:anti-sigma regulatory factor (Ser/Thr protein kinase)